MSDPIAVIAHRGASGPAGEGNTLRSFAVAIELGCDYVEFDLRPARDEIVCFHDALVGDTPIAELSLAELRTRSGKAVPTFSEVLRFCRGRIGLDVEIKTPGIEADVVAGLRDVQDDTPLMIKSFDTSVVAHLVSMAPGYAVGLLVDRASDTPVAEPLKAAIMACRKLGADFVSPHHSLVGDDATTSEALQQMPTYPWTVNDEAEMARLVARPIRGLITDRPDLLLNLLRGAT